MLIKIEIKPNLARMNCQKTIIYLLSLCLWIGCQDEQNQLPTNKIKRGQDYFPTEHKWGYIKHRRGQT